MNVASEFHGKGIVVIEAAELEAMMKRVAKDAAREALIELQDRQSFLAVNDWLTHEQVEELLGRSRSWVNTRRKMRYLAKNDADRDAAFAPSYQPHRGAHVRFRRSEIEAWQNSYSR